MLGCRAYIVWAACLLLLDFLNIARVMLAEQKSMGLVSN